MVRMAIGGTILLLLCVIAVLVFHNYGSRTASDKKSDVLGQSTPPSMPGSESRSIAEKPPVPAPEAPAANNQPPVAPQPNLGEAALPPGLVPEPRAEVVALPEPRLTPGPEVGRRTHVVQPGESLWTISRKYYGNQDRSTEIARLNSLKSLDRIRVGQVLVLPGAATVAVVPPAPVIDDAPAPETDHHEIARVPERVSEEEADHEDAPLLPEHQPPTLNATRKIEKTLKK